MTNERFNGHHSKASIDFDTNGFMGTSVGGQYANFGAVVEIGSNGTFSSYYRGWNDSVNNI